MAPEASAKKLKSSAGLFAALGDETRLRLIVRLCEKGPLSITELTAATDVSRQAVTKHLHLLEHERLVRSSRQGRTQIWEIEAKRLEIAQEYLELISTRWDSALERLKVFVEK
ncbi:MAG: metalloregulator ArsR/SmtB family transcription factor [Bdellovibrionota bacterium]